MRFEIEGKEVADKTIKRVNVLPSDENGLFVIDHSGYAQRTVGKIGLAGMAQESVEEIEAGNVEVADCFEEREDGVIVPKEGITLAATIALDHTANTLSINPEAFREMSAVPLR